MKEIARRCEKALGKLAGRFGIAYGIVFGSAGIGRMRKDSDLDVAVKLKKGPEKAKDALKIISEISGALERELSIETDVILINNAGLGLKYEIFKTGKLAFASDFREFVEDSSGTVMRFLDMKPFHQNYYESMLKRMI